MHNIKGSPCTGTPLQEGGIKMAFYAEDFIFNNIPSEFYDLYIGEIDASGTSSTTGSNDVSLLTKKLFRRPVPLFFGAEQTPVLEFALSAYFRSEISAQAYPAVGSWLFGHQNYKVLRICQDDMQNIYFNAFFTSPEIMRIGNMIHGLTTRVICDAPWGWKDSSVYTESWGGIGMSDTISYYNESSNNFYTYPTELKITANSVGGSVTITNQSDSNRQFILTLSGDEVVTINCDLQTISSDSVALPLARFNKNWLRFIKGVNTLLVVGNVASISITSPIAVKVG